MENLIKYRIEIKRTAQKALAKIPKEIQLKVIDAIKGLSLNPHPQNSKKLTGRSAWRIRIGNYRVIYEINNNVLLISIIVVSHRKNVYNK